MRKAQISIQKLGQTNSKLETELADAQTRADGAEDRGRRKNLSLFGLPERSEQIVGLTMRQYIQQKLTAWLNLPPGRVIEIERVHRSLQPEPARGKPPRPILIRFLRFTDVEGIMQAAKDALSPIKEGEATLSFRRDLSAGTRKRRKGFNRAIKVLIQKGAFRGFAHPARLRVYHGGKLELYDTPEKAEDFITQQGWELPEPDT